MDLRLGTEVSRIPIVC